MRPKMIPDRLSLRLLTPLLPNHRGLSLALVVMLCERRSR